ncbi:hypothetical protein [Actinomadura decatromicini]|nr:hypothetical protein [Actinomadura decatromicini]
MLAIGEEIGASQPGWSRCQACQGLYYSGAGRSGSCAATLSGSGGHYQAKSGYSLEYAGQNDAQEHRQPGWRWCDKCELLWFGARATFAGNHLWNGAARDQCPRDVLGHRYYDYNANYRVPHVGLAA